MSVYIKGMEMPENCITCPFFNNEYEFCTRTETAVLSVEQVICEKPNWCPIVPAADVAPVQRWIPVTERLPESGVHVLASCRVKYVGGGGRSYVCDAFYSEHFKEQGSTEYDDIELDYDEETNEYYLPEGWWEVILNWDEYGFVGIVDFVTHWMPLPEPPKEEADA